MNGCGCRETKDGSLDSLAPPRKQKLGVWNLLAFCLFEMTGGRGFAPNERAANGWMWTRVTKGWVS